MAVEQQTVGWRMGGVDLPSGLLEDSRLTTREAEILARISEGKTNAEIGLALSISPRTVKKH